MGDRAADPSPSACDHGMMIRQQRHVIASPPIKNILSLKFFHFKQPTHCIRDILSLKYIGHFGSSLGRVKHREIPAKLGATSGGRS
jgi:hypothetical protein